MKALAISLLLIYPAQGMAAPTWPEPNCKLPKSKANYSSKKKVSYYLSKLKDRSCTGKYGDGGTWYTAAEELGALGETAIPGLIEKLNSNDPYELSVALYALLLASQADSVKGKTNGEYVHLEVVLSEEHNAVNKKIALDWWKKHGSKIKA